MMRQKPHQAVVSQITAVIQRRNDNKSYQEKDSIMQNKTIPIGTSKSGRIDCRHIADQLVVAEKSVDFTKHTMVISTQTRTERQRRENCNCHGQELERSQLFERGRDHATQLVGADVSVDFTKHALLLSSHEHEQRDKTNETIVIVTDK